MKFTPTEKEVIVLKAVIELIDSMVNFEVFNLYGNDPHTSIGFRTMTHQKYFNIILLDFLSCFDEKVLGEKRTYLESIRTICQSSNFNKNNLIENLKKSTEDFIIWLEQEVQVKTWLPSIDAEVSLSIKRIEFIKICGNISKHNFTRLSRVAKDLMTILKRNAINISFEDSLLILDDFYEIYHSDIFNYHSSTIAEFLNNIRWAVYEYLLPEFCQSIVYEGIKRPKKYHYTYPKELKNNFAQNCYWDLMNIVRSKPYMRKFKVTRYLKMYY